MPVPARLSPGMIAPNPITRTPGIRRRELIVQITIAALRDQHPLAEFAIAHFNGSGILQNVMRTVVALDRLYRSYVAICAAGLLLERGRLRIKFFVTHGLGLSGVRFRWRAKNETLFNDLAILENRLKFEYVLREKNPGEKCE